MSPLPAVNSDDRQDQQPALHGVESSIAGQKWIGLSAEQDRMAYAISEQTGLPHLLSRVLARQGNTPESAVTYLEPTVRSQIGDPMSLKDMEKAVSRFLQAVRQRERIAIFADYDVDGGCSAALISDWLGHSGIGATLYVPDRVKEGFGPNVAAMKRLASEHDLIICVDCGTSAIEPIKAADGADVIVIDHHVGDAELPPAFAVVNPNRQDETSEFVNMCAAGVVFLFLMAVNRADGRHRKDLPDLKQMLDLVALATVADVSPLVGLNRALVRVGIEVISQRRRPGLRALHDLTGIRSPPNSGHIAFALAPRINAGGRIGQSDIGARLLATSKLEEAERLARELNELNVVRREMVESAFTEALAQADRRGLEAPLVWAAGKGWHPGIVGIVAARLCETANRPAVAISLSDGKGRGSARSIKGVSIGTAVVRCRDEGLLLNGGGHNMAAGLEVEEPLLEAAMERIGQMLEVQGTAVDAPRVVQIDGELQPQAATVHLIEQLEQAGPFGSGAPHPRVVMPFQRIVYRRPVGDDHLQLTIKSDAGHRMDCIAFRVMNKPLGKTLNDRNIGQVHLMGRLEVDHYRGRATPKLHVDDAALA